MGRSLTIYLKFKSELDLIDAFPYLFKEIFKDFFIPIGVRYGFTFKDKEPLRGILGLDPELVHFSSPLFQNEELINELYLTKYTGDTFLSELIDLVSRAKIERGPIHLAGIVNIYYQKNSSIKKGWFLREKNVGESMRIIAGGGTEYPNEEFLTPILKTSVINDENYSSIHLTTSSNVFLKTRFKKISYERTDDIILDNSKAGELNWNIMIDSLYDFSSEFLPYLEETDFTLEGSIYFNEFGRLREKIKVLPKFADSEYKFMQSKKK